jgi:endoglycosylceramidase
LKAETSSSGDHQTNSNNNILITSIFVSAIIIAIYISGAVLAAELQDISCYEPDKSNESSKSPSAPPQGSEDPRLSLKSDGFHDQEGRRVYFRGVNVAGNAKLPPFIPFEDPRWWDLLASWGFNMVRLTLFWEAVEPEPGVYNRTYLKKVREMVDQASLRGIYVLLDMHQDEYSRWLNGDGAPAWALPEGVDPRGNNGFAGRYWFLGYALSSDVRACFTNFFQSTALRDRYKGAWVEVAKSVKGSPYILGYDMMNEPSCGDLPNDEGQFENGFLKLLYQDVISSIRQVEPEAVGFVEPHVLDTYGSKLTPLQADRLVYAPHLYDPISSAFTLAPSQDGMRYLDLLRCHEEMAERLGMPLFIGEFGSPWTTAQRNEHVNSALEALEEEFVDNAYWDYSVKDVSIWNGEDFSLIDREGRPRGLEVNVRPYLRRLKGSPLLQSFDAVNKTYNVSFESEAGAVAVIYVPEAVQYPQGFRVSAGDGIAEYHRGRGELRYSPKHSGRHNITIKG